MNKRRRVAQQKRRKTRERLRAKERAARQADAGTPATTTPVRRTGTGA